MAQRPVGIENMAVSSDISTSQHNMKDNGNEENDFRGNQNNPKVDVPKKKTTFKITSVTKSSLRGGSGDLTQDNDLDSQDDLDDTVDSHTEDLSSEIYDTNSKTTDVDIQDPLLTPEEVLIKEKPARFKVVKVETKEPFKRGRWICYDYLDDKTETKQEEIHVNSGSSSAANSVHYVHGVDDPSKNPLIAGATGTMTSQVQPSNVPEGISTAQGENFQPIQPAPSSQPSATPVSLTNASVSNIVAQSSSSVPYYVPQSGQPAAQSMPSSSSSSLRIMNSASNLPHSPQNQTQPSQSGPSGQPHPHPSQQVPVNPANVHSQPATLAGSVVSQQTPPGAMQTGDYVNSSGAGQGSAPQGQTVSSSQAQQQLPAGYVTAVSSASGITGNIPIPQQKHPMTATSKALDGYEENDVYPSQVVHANSNSAIRSSDQGETTMSTLELAVGGITSTPGEDDITEEAGSSTVAIDNKIEQAMDLVKSHLMYAVREEVEVLKAQIKELMERMRTVEYENKVLRGDATPETLAKLPAPLPPLQNPYLQQFMTPQPAPSSSSS